MEVGYYISHKIRFKRILEYSNYFFLIAVCYNLFLLNPLTFAWVIYRHPNSNMSIFNVEFSNILEFLSTHERQIFLLGDFNVNFLIFSPCQLIPTYLFNLKSKSIRCLEP